MPYLLKILSQVFTQNKKRYLNFRQFEYRFISSTFRIAFLCRECWDIHPPFHAPPFYTSRQETHELRMRRSCNTDSNPPAPRAACTTQQMTRNAHNAPWTRPGHRADTTWTCIYGKANARRKQSTTSIHLHFALANSTSYFAWSHQANRRTGNSHQRGRHGGSSSRI